MIYAFVFVIGSVTQFFSELPGKRDVAFDYEPPRMIKKVRPLQEVGERVVLYPYADSAR